MVKQFPLLPPMRTVQFNPCSAESVWGFLEVLVLCICSLLNLSWRAIAIWFCIRFEAFGFHKLWLTLWRKKRWTSFHVRHFNAEAKKALEWKGGKAACLTQWGAEVSKPTFTCSTWAWEHPKSSWTELTEYCHYLFPMQQAITGLVICCNALP